MLYINTFDLVRYVSVIMTFVVWPHAFYNIFESHRKVKYMEVLAGEGKVGYIGFGEVIEKWST